MARSEDNSTIYFDNEAEAGYSIYSGTCRYARPGSLWVSLLFYDQYWFGPWQTGLRLIESSVRGLLHHVLAEKDALARYRRVAIFTLVCRSSQLLAAENLSWERS